ncbi:TetR/AcrR family transcriptional regulator [Aeromicrobium ginsengisoli]|uniref:TetR/AcrR family transcriptional regulator n=1 Tax=Aeromicrobium ginsengisoli TaxID=363867 RepID=A0A5M4FEP7_9ACTN|nr:TetR/AcrR family transcriptional regulator [Aeromicrobium ginsengisoli]KAA1397827.1 TetR/AcrR family transcriptional regulator [Aeromicrobium ginsengisoli]
MARYGKEHKDITRRRIIDAASKRFKQDGFDGSGVATLMSDAGLTNGAFYAHFESKDDLVATVVHEELSRQAASFSDLKLGRDGLQDFVREYLSTKHRDHPDVGCPSAALLDEIGRSSAAAKQAYTVGAKAILKEIASRLSPHDPDAAQGTALNLFTMMIGTMQLARALSDRRLSKTVLENGAQSALAMIAADQRT